MSIKEKLGLVLFGLFLCAVLLEITMRIGDFAISSMQDYRNRLSMRERGQYRILCLGESTTVWKGKDCYPSQLEEILNKMNTGIKFSVINKGRPGITTAFILAELEDNLRKYSPDAVITMMGVNDENEDFNVAYVDSSEKGALFFKSFRLYKLVKMLRSRIINKVQELGLGASRETVVSQKDELYTPLFCIEQKEFLKDFLEQSSDTCKKYVEFKKSLVNQRGHDEVEEKLQRAMREMPDNPWSYMGLGRYYWQNGKLSEANEMFKKATEIDPKNEWLHIEIVMGYVQAKEGYAEVEQICKKIIEINPNNAWGYAWLGWYYLKKNEYSKAEKLFKKAAEIDPKNEIVYLLLGDCYSNKGDYEKCETAFKTAIKINPNNCLTYVEFGKYYWGKKEHNKAKDILNEAMRLSGGNSRLYGILANFYSNQGQCELAEEYFRKGNGLMSHYYNPMTRRNYERLKDIVTRKGIKLVCVQYPVRSVEPLKKLFDSTEGIIFVDNEMVFKEALKQGKYEDYFVNIFAGDFGHCTRKGNRLLAENIAGVMKRRLLASFFQ